MKNGSIKMLSQKNFFDFVTPQGLTDRQIQKKLLLPNFEIFSERLLDTLNFYSISMKNKADLKHVFERKFNWPSKNLNRNCEKNPQNFYFQRYLLRNRGNFCLSMVPSFKSSAASLNLKIWKNHYYIVKLQEKWLYKNAIAKKLFWK